MRLKLLTILIPALLCTAAARAGLTLNEAIERAYSCSLIRKTAALEVEVVNAERWQGSLLPNPALTIEVDNVGGCHDDDTEISASIAQLFPIGGKRCARHTFDSARIDIAQWDYEIVSQDLLQSLIAAFIEAFIWQEKCVLAKQQLEVAQQSHKCTNGKCEAGKATVLQEKRAGLAFHHAQIKLNKTESACTVAKHELAALWEGEPDFESLDFPLFQFEEPPPLEALEEALVENNPELGRANSEVTAGLASIDFEETMRIPDVVVEAGVGGQRNFRDTNFFVSLSFPLPLFDRNQGNRARASFQSWQAAYQRESTEVQTRKNLKSCFLAWKDAYKGAKATFELEQALAKETLQSSEESFQQGKIDRQEWLDTQKMWLETKEQALDAALDYQMKRLDTLRLTGQIHGSL